MSGMHTNSTRTTLARYAEERHGTVPYGSLPIALERSHSDLKKGRINPKFTSVATSSTYQNFKNTIFYL